VIKKRQAAGEFAGDPGELFARVTAAARKGESNSRVLETIDGRALRVMEQPMQGGGWVATLEDITKWREDQAQISHMARHDGLTDLPNRTLFREQLEYALSRVMRNERVAVFCLDLDNFKYVNDSLGHPIGDDLLKKVSLRLCECVRAGDTVSRLGGDEFAIVQVGVELRAPEISALASRIVEVVGAP
jgi:GGDEF domain-containing protein